MTTSEPQRPRWALRTWLLPPLTVFLFLMHPLIVWRNPAVLLSDPGTGWHLATGRYILDTGSIPGRDVFSFTAAGREWIQYYWLFDVIAAGLVELGGLPLYATACMLVYAAIPVLLFRRMLRMGTGLAPAFGLMLVAYAILLSHALARPHAVTYLFFAILLERLDGFQRGALPARALWWLPALTALWCNVHGGFVAGLAMTGVFAMVAALRSAVFQDPAERTRAIVFALVLSAMVLTTLLNPNGPRLHVSIVEHLQMETTKYYHEFRSPDFLLGGITVAVFEQLVLTVLLLVALGPRRISWIEGALIVFFLHQALQSVRHMNLFAIVAAPIVARELSDLLDGLAPRVQRRLRRIAAEQREWKGHFVYVPAVCAALLAAAIAGATPFPETLDDQQLGKGAAEYIDAHKDRFSRMFNTDNMGGSLIYRFWPELRVFMDDRVSVYGDDFTMKKYFAVLHLRKNWHDVLDEYGVTSAVVTSGTGCATLFRESPRWKVEHEDDKTTIFLRRDARQ